jgi:serine protease inhibitor
LLFLINFDAFTPSLWTTGCALANMPLDSPHHAPDQHLDLSADAPSALSDTQKLHLINRQAQNPTDSIASNGKERLAPLAPKNPSAVETLRANVPNANVAADASRVLVAGLQRFSFDLMRSLHQFEDRDTSPGLLFSPFSVWGTLLIALVGARGSSQTELQTALGLSDTTRPSALLAYQAIRMWYDLRHANSTSANGDANGRSTDVLATANRLFFNANLRLNRVVRERLRSESEVVDFSNPEQARRRINSWVSTQTRQKVPELLSPGSVNSFTSLVLANAVYLHQRWLLPFERSQTIEGVFHVNPAEQLSAQYMQMTSNLMTGVSDTLRCRMLELPYADRSLSMLVLLPDPQAGVDQLLKRLRPDSLRQLLGALYEDEVVVRMPKFKFEQEFELAGPLYSMGVRRVFDPRHSDFSGFLEPPSDTSSNSTSDQLPVIVNSVVHKALIAVDEEGTEAAAATATLIARSG